MRLREIVDKCHTSNDGTRLLTESVISPEVLLALKDWIKNNQTNCVLIGGLALSYHGVPRYTQDVDVLYPNRYAIPVEIVGFKQHRGGAFQHNKTHVEVEVVSPESFTTISSDLVQAVFITSKRVEGIQIASREGLIALKAEANRKGSKHAQDIADIMHLLEIGPVDMSAFPLTQQAKELINKLQQEVSE